MANPSGKDQESNAGGPSQDRPGGASHEIQEEARHGGEGGEKLVAAVSFVAVEEANGKVQAARDKRNRAEQEFRTAKRAAKDQKDRKADRELRKADRELEEADKELQKAGKELQKVAKEALENVNKVLDDILHPSLPNALEDALNKVEEARVTFRTAIRAAKDQKDKELRKADREPEEADKELQKVAEALENVNKVLDDIPHPSPPNALEDAVKKVEEARERIQRAQKEVNEAGSPAEKELRKAAKEFAESGRRVSESTFQFLPTAYTEIKNLIDLERYPEHKRALEEWRRKDNDLSSKVSRREARSSDVTNQIFNIIGWYAVFLGVMLTALTQLTTKSVCGKVWFPVVLTGIGLIITVCGIIYKFRILESLEITIQSDKQISEELQRRINKLQRIGPKKFSFRFDTDDNLTKRLPKSFWRDSGLVIAALVLLTGFFILSYFVILCDTWTRH